MIILIIGLPASGKTTLAKALAVELRLSHLEADVVREQHADWDFSAAGRLRQAKRMKELAKKHSNVICDFVCPTSETRAAFGEADAVIWMDRTPEKVYTDTQKLWERPKQFDIRIPDGLTVKQEVKQIKELLIRKQLL